MIDYQNIAQEVYDKGISVIPSMLTEEQAKNVKEEVLQELQGCPYEFGKARNFGHLNSLSKQSRIYHVFQSKPFTEIAWHYYGLAGVKHFDYGQCVMATHDYIHQDDEEKFARNGFLHFDRGHCFKFMIYLTDVSEKDGPLSYIPETHTVGKKLREKAWNITKDYSAVQNRLEVDYEELGYKAEDTIKVYGSAGTVIVFDTDTFHLGGLISKGGERVVLRLHCKP